MVTAGFEVIIKPSEDCLAIVTNLRSLAMHELRCAHNLTAEDLTNRLMSETHTEDWNLTCEVLDSFK